MPNETRLTKRQGLFALIGGAALAAFCGFNWVSAAQVGTGGWLDAYPPEIRPGLSIPGAVVGTVLALVGIVLSTEGDD